MLHAQQFHDFLIPTGSSRTMKKNLAPADAAKHQARLRAGKIREAGDHEGA